MKLLVLLCLLLNGCAVYSKHNTELYLICYKDPGVMLPNGMWQSNTLYYKCNQRRLIDFEHKFGVDHQPHIFDFTKKD